MEKISCPRHPLARPWPSQADQCHHERDESRDVPTDGLKKRSPRAVAATRLCGPGVRAPSWRDAQHSISVRAVLHVTPKHQLRQELYCRVTPPAVDAAVRCSRVCGVGRRHGLQPRVGAIPRSRGCGHPSGVAVGTRRSVRVGCGAPRGGSGIRPRWSFDRGSRVRTRDAAGSQRRIHA